MKKIEIARSRIAPQLRVVSVQASKVDPELVAKAFGAQASARVGELDVFGLRDAISAFLVSNGGRPSIAGANAQVKIPRIDADWKKLERIAQATGSLPHSPSVTQTAALILHMALSRITEDELEAEMRKAFG